MTKCVEFFFFFVEVCLKIQKFSSKSVASNQGPFASQAEYLTNLAKGPMQKRLHSTVDRTQNTWWLGAGSTPDSAMRFFCHFF